MRLRPEDICSVKTEKRSITIFRYLINSIFYALTACLILLALPRFFGFTYITIESGSMRPALEVGSLCLLSEDKDEYAHLTPSDIITYDMGGDASTLVTHRIYCHNADKTYTTKGDANEFPDKQNVKTNQILGIVQYHIPYLGYLVAILDQKAVKLIVVSVSISLALVSILLERDRPSNKKRIKSQELCSSS